MGFPFTLFEGNSRNLVTIIPPGHPPFFRGCWKPLSAPHVSQKFPPPTGVIPLFSREIKPKPSPNHAGQTNQATRKLVNLKNAPEGMEDPWRPQLAPSQALVGGNWTVWTDLPEFVQYPFSFSRKPKGKKSPEARVSQALFPCANFALNLGPRTKMANPEPGELGPIAPLITVGFSPGPVWDCARTVPRRTGPPNAFLEN